jgi:FkbM family methyltransferase
MKKVSRINLRGSLFLFRLQGNSNDVKSIVLKKLDLVDRIINKNREEIKFADYIIKMNKKGTSQFYQDFFVTYALHNKKNGFFVEFGACDGVHLSNTYLLEKNFNWTGILSEPAKIWHEALKRNRDCKINIDCISPFSGQKVGFSETIRPELSTINTHLKNDLHSSRRIVSLNYEVNTLSLNDLLLLNNAPTEIDLISIDTEGNELEIIEQFDFNKYKTLIIIIEHNYDKNKKMRLRKLFKNQNFKLVFSKISGPDYWFISNELKI